MEDSTKYVYKDGKKIEKTIAESSKTFLSENPIVRKFFKKKFDIALNLADLKKDDTILDFGCGESYIKKNNPQFNIVGYDVNPKQTEINDYTKISPNKIFVIDVLEHIPKEEIEKIIQNFKQMSSKFDLIVAIPTENWLSKKARKLLGKPEKVRDHITSLKEILKLLKKEFELKKKRNLLTVTYILSFKYIKN